MLSIDNINLLKSRFSSLYTDLHEYEQSDSLVDFESVIAKSGDPTIKVRNEENEIYLHSTFNPITEAEIILEQYTDNSAYEHIVFYGTGLGYHIRAFMDKYPKKKYYIYEPSLPLLYEFLSLNDLNRQIECIGYGSEITSMEAFMLTIMQKSKKYVQIIDLPAHKNIFRDEYSQFISSFQKIVKSNRFEVRTDFTFQKQWVLSAMNNYPHILESNNILEYANLFKGKTAIIAAAGPSLTEDMENLRFIKENGLAYIFSVGSAINAFLKHGFYPHAACSYDPQLEEYDSVFHKLLEENITEIPLLFASTTGTAVSKYPGDKLHMIINQDTLAPHYLKLFDGRRPFIVHDAPTISAVTLELLYLLGFSTIVFAGQNLAFLNDKEYAEGIDYRSYQNDKSNVVEDVYGKDVYTNESFNVFRNSIETYIANMAEVKFINSTKGGAKIEGAEFIPLEELIRQELKERVVDDDWYKKECIAYDHEFLHLQSKNMEIAYEQYQKHLQKIEDALNNIVSLYRNQNYKQIEKMYSKFDSIIQKINNNEFAITFVFPMNRLYYNFLQNDINNTLIEKNPRLKAEQLINQMRKYIYLCKQDLKTIYPKLQEIHKKFQEYYDLQLEENAHD